MSAQDGSYDDLPSHLKHLIDTAFDSTLDHFNNPAPHDFPRKRRKINHNGNNTEQEIEPGGFIIDDTSTTLEPGGFLLPSPSPPPQQTPSDTIPLSLIPPALAHLSLPTDDEDVLRVFRTAASGWSRPHTHMGPSQQGKGQEQEGAVSRKDFRAVCAVLLEAEAEVETHSSSAIPTQIPQGGGFLIEDDDDKDEEMDEGELTPDSDLYQDPSDPDSDDGSADEYIDSPSRHQGKLSTASRAKSKGKGKARVPASDSDSSTPADHSETKTKTATPHQKREARLAFALFFPPDSKSNDAGGSDDDKLAQQRLTAQDLTRVAGVLKEKISVEETKEMLAQFSTCPDGSMSLADFERMMLVAGLV